MLQGLCAAIIDDLGGIVRDARSVVAASAQIPTQTMMTAKAYSSSCCPPASAYVGAPPSLALLVLWGMMGGTHHDTHVGTCSRWSIGW